MKSFGFFNKHVKYEILSSVVKKERKRIALQPAQSSIPPSRLKSEVKRKTLNNELDLCRNLNGNKSSLFSISNFSVFMKSATEGGKINFQTSSTTYGWTVGCESSCRICIYFSTLFCHFSSSMPDMFRCQQMFCVFSLLLMGRA